MKIAFLAFSFVPNIGGAQIFTYNLMSRLAARGHAVHLYIPRYWSKRYRALEPRSAFKVFSLCVKDHQLMRFCPVLVSGLLVLRQLAHRYDVWQVVGSYPAGYAARYLSRMVPVVLRAHGQDIQKNEKLMYGDRLNDDCEQKIKLTLKSMNKLVALTPSVMDDYSCLGVENEKIVQIPNGIDLGRFRKKVDRSRIRHDFGIGDDCIFILTVGRYHLKKGYEYIPEAARYLCDKGYSFKWLIVGKHADTIAPLISQQCVEDVVLCIDKMGFKKFDPGSSLNVPSDVLVDLYKAADIFVMPSLLETFGMVLIEAMAAGASVVTTDAPGCRDVVQHERTGMVGKAADSISLAKNIERIICAPALRKELIDAGYKAAESYDWSHVADEYEKLYTQVMSGYR